jgi:hypothetical protein
VPLSILLQEQPFSAELASLCHELPDRVTVVAETRLDGVAGGKVKGSPDGEVGEANAAQGVEARVPADAGGILGTVRLLQEGPSLALAEFEQLPADRAWCGSNVSSPPARCKCS